MPKEVGDHHNIVHIVDSDGLWNIVLEEIKTDEEIKTETALHNIHTKREHLPECIGSFWIS